MVIRGEAKQMFAGRLFSITDASLWPRAPGPKRLRETDLVTAVHAIKLDYQNLLARDSVNEAMALASSECNRSYQKGRSCRVEREGLACTD